MRMALIAAIIALPASADPGLYTGQDGSGSLSRFPCHSCHGRDGRGGIEGTAPDLVALAGRYDAPSLLRVLAEGVASDGRALSRSMPRYRDVTEDQAAGLLREIDDLPRRDRIGISPDRVILGVIADGPDDPYPAMLDSALSRALSGARLYGRGIVLQRFVSAEQAAEQALALIGPPSGAEAAAISAGLPVLFPRASLEGDEDPTILRGLSAPDTAIAAVLASDLRARGGPAAIRVMGQVPDGLAWALSFEFPGAATSGDIPVLLGPGAAPADRSGLPPGMPAYLMPQAISADPALPERLARGGWQPVLVLDAPALVEAMVARQIGPYEAHATLAATVVVRALRSADRDLGRRRLLDALAESELTDLGLDYRRDRLAGTSAVRLMPLEE